LTGIRPVFGHHLTGKARVQAGWTDPARPFLAGKVQGAAAHAMLRRILARQVRESQPDTRLIYA
jgi:hypothetical protein